MVENKISKFEDYTDSLQLFKSTYLYDGYSQDIKKYALFSDNNRGVTDILRYDGYSDCIQIAENGKSTWRILSPKNIFGVELERSINHKKLNSVTTKLILNAGRFDLNRMMVRFAEIDVTNLKDKELLDLVEGILGKTNEQLILEYEITQNPNGILSNAIILDTILMVLRKQDSENFPEIFCNAEDSSIIVISGDKEIKISNNLVEIGEQFIKYNTINEFPNCKFEIQGIKTKDVILSDVVSKLTEFNSEKNEKLDSDILFLALKNSQLNQQYASAAELYTEYKVTSDRISKYDKDNQEWS